MSETDVPADPVTVPVDEVSRAVNTDGVTVKQEQMEIQVDYDEEKKKLQDKAYRFMAKQSHPVIIPSFSSWFDFAEVHEIEKKAIPDFFDGSALFKTPKIYKDTRNFMVNTFRLAPYEYLTVTAVRKNLGMDVASIIKIHSFLEKWGLINYQIDPRSKASLIGPKYNGYFQVELDVPEGLKPFVPSKLVKDLAAEGDNEDKDQVASESVYKDPEQFPVNVSLKKTLYDHVTDYNSLISHDKSLRPIRRTFLCHTCGNDTVFGHYHNLRARDINLCTKCFQEGHFGANFQASDFIKLDNNANSDSKTWTNQELFLLLEGIEIYEDQWEKIAEHVGNAKTVIDCVEKFIKLPIEDRFINDSTKPKKSDENASAAKNNQPELEVVKAVDNTIKSLLTGSHQNILNKALPESAQKNSDRHMKEIQVVAQELLELEYQKFDLKFEQLDALEKTMQDELNEYNEEAKQIANMRGELSKEVNSINKELSALNFSKKLVLASEQVDSTVKSVEKEEKAVVSEAETENIQRKTNENLSILMHAQPQIFKAWSL